MSALITQEAFAAAYSRYFKQTEYFLRSKGLAPEEAEELAQEAWVKAWVHAEQWRGEASFASWVIIIALNLYRMTLRRKPVEQLDSEHDKPLFSSAIDYEIDSKTCLQLLHAKEAVYLHMHYVEGLTLNEMVERTGLHVANVKTRTHRALFAVRSLVVR